MKTKDFAELEKRLLPTFPGFATKGRLLFICPVERTLRGFHFEPSAFSEKAFYVNMFFLPLCVPAKRAHFTFGHRVGSEKRWSRDKAGLETDLASEMRKAIPFLTSLKTPQKVAKALEPFAKRLNPHCHEAFAYSLIQAGEARAAEQALDNLLHLIETPWQKEIASRAQLVREKLRRDIGEAQKQLDTWEIETVSNLGLEPFRPSSCLPAREAPWDSMST